jgi:hypothetical protein
MGSNFFFILAKLLCGREVKEMAVVYATLIIKGKKTMEQVPERLKADVAEILEACEVAL